MAEIAGPLGRVLSTVDLAAGRHPRANALTVLRRCAVLGPGGNLDESSLLAWAVRTNLGHDDQLAAAVHRRRSAALAALSRHDAPGDGEPVVSRVVSLEPESALLAGTGESGPRNVGLALHGTYGWPVLRGSTLKGVALAYATAVEDPDRHAIFGSAPQDDEPAPGEVAFLDAIWSGPVRAAPHVLTPHAGDYYRDATRRTPPAEWANPVPVAFLAVEGGVFRAAVLGPRPLADRAAALLRAAADDLGVGAKTAAGYGYLRATDPEPEGQPE
ncbi:hypothetical protein AWW66_26605 [Micromonospora rosaria]|uniref:CRISPR type III-associated protein domain-containing protein n=1 Tax=Micromonospora rosaria TaxID=47874 RepID=A0A136PKV9_9ACTN|nr:type III-B CRISPR module RAMP protein Cmr6 [Micromonospora rosaria]KXK59004.1 hypothetical protein AWW66_26605 [Micromonospora rosaria]